MDRCDHAARASARKVSRNVAKSSERRRQLTTLYDVTPDDVEQILAISADLKNRMQRGDRPSLLQGRVLTLIFEKPSLRTRNSFEAAAIQLGGGSVFLTTQDAGLNGRESLADIARVLSSYSDVIVMRTFSQSLIEELRAALAVSGRQRTFGRFASLPGTDRPVHDPRDFRTAGRPASGLHRRRQQRGGVAGDGRRVCRACPSLSARRRDIGCPRRFLRACGAMCRRQN